MNPRTPWFHRRPGARTQRGVVALGAPLESGPLFRGAGLMPATLRDAGLDWDELTTLLSPVVRNDAMLGLDIAAYDPGKDPDRRFATRVVRLLADVLGEQTTGAMKA